MVVKTLNIRGKLMSLEKPAVMGILNVTPDSFYAESRMESKSRIMDRIGAIIREGGAFVDIGAYSTRPDAAEVSEKEEWDRLEPALKIALDYYPEIPVSLDTFRSGIAKRAVEDYGVAVINDISGGMIDDKMFETVAGLKVPYVLMHIKGSPQTMQQNTGYKNLFGEVMMYFSEKMQALRLLGVNDIITDPGFGFSKTTDQNYELMGNLREFSMISDCPVLVGISRKSMIYKFLNTSPEESLNGTTVLNTFSLLNGADILRVHDVKAATEAVELINKIIN
jgi:dihydropteroate synthase